MKVFFKFFKLLKPLGKARIAAPVLFGAMTVAAILTLLELLFRK